MNANQLQAIIVLVASQLIGARPQQLETVKAEVDVGLQWKVHHAQQVTFLVHDGALKFTTFTFVNY